MEYLTAKLKDIDLTKSEVSLKFNKQESHGTVIGGFCSLLILIFSASVLVSELYAVTFLPSFSENISRNWRSPTDKTPATINVE